MSKVVFLGIALGLVFHVGSSRLMGSEVANRGGDESVDIEVVRPTLEQLERLAKRKEWSRILVLIKGISKPDQDLQWKSLVERASMGYLKQFSEEGASETENLAQELLREFPLLSEAQSFQNLREKLLFSEFNRCFSKKSDLPVCQKRALALMESPSTSPRLRQKWASFLHEKSAGSLDKVCQILKDRLERQGFFETHCH